MKFRTDFVTNSSSSSFLIFHIENKPLLHRLEALGIRFDNVSQGDFSNGMRVTLPTGQSACIQDDAMWHLPDLDGSTSLSAWLLWALISASEDYSEEIDDNYVNFSCALRKLLSDAGLIEPSEDNYAMPAVCPETDTFDDHLGAATVSVCSSFERDLECSYTEVADGIRQTVEYCNEDPIETQSIQGVRFAATGKTKFFKTQAHLFEAIEKLGGIVCDKIDSSVDFMICNDVRRRCKKMRSALELSIPILTEAAFLRRFTDITELEQMYSDSDVAIESLQLIHTGKVLDFVAEHGTQPVPTLVRKEGKWR